MTTSATITRSGECEDSSQAYLDGRRLRSILAVHGRRRAGVSTSASMSLLDADCWTWAVAPVSLR